MDGVSYRGLDDFHLVERPSAAARIVGQTAYKAALRGGVWGAAGWAIDYFSGADDWLATHGLPPVRIIAGSLGVLSGLIGGPLSGLKEYKWARLSVGEQLRYVGKNLLEINKKTGDAMNRLSNLTATARFRYRRSKSKEDKDICKSILESCITLAGKARKKYTPDYSSNKVEDFESPVTSGLAHSWVRRMARMADRVEHLARKPLREAGEEI